MDIPGTTLTALAQGQAQLTRQSPTATDPMKTAAKEFEAVFLSQVMDEMLKTVNMGSLGGGFAEDTWRSFLAQAYAEELAEQGTTGIAQSVQKSIGAYRAAMASNGGLS
ncbi:rod-binding protein [Pseudooceanicola sp. MF1-13]|uniref:rod-binding protein n=1 Tax=Pseudooceanicola sp. MF1-13 TaxID=3379095 RepID=UPI003892C822